MPAKSGPQYRLMSMIAHGKKSDKSIGPSKEVAKKFVKETSKKKRSLFMKKDKDEDD